MQHIRLGNTGLKISRLCLGTMTFGWSADEQTAHQIMDAAFDAGINCFDTANIYTYKAQGGHAGMSEEIIGRWLKDKPRHKVVIATKVRGLMWDGPNGQGLSRHHIMQAIEGSLRRLQTDYIDLYQVHWPDDETSQVETLRALDDLIRAGKVRYIGASNHTAWMLMRALWTSSENGLARYESLQPRYSLLSRSEYENQLIDVCRDQNLGVIPYSPLAAGFLTGKYSRSNRHNVNTTRSGSSVVRKLIDDERAYDVLETVQSMADDYDVPFPQIPLAWMLAQDTISAAIVGARSVEQLQPLLGSDELVLSPDDVEQLTTISQPF